MKQAPLDQDFLWLKDVTERRGEAQKIRASWHPEEQKGWRQILNQVGASGPQRLQRSAHGSPCWSVGADAAHSSGRSRGSDLETAKWQPVIGAGRRRAPGWWRRAT